jgi:hypothetical protein
MSDRSLGAVPAATVTVRLSDGPATVTLRPDATVLALGDATVSSYDLCGRPYVLVRGESTFRRALDGRVLEKRPATGGEPRVRRRLDPAESPAALEPARSEAEAILRALAGAAGIPEEQGSETRRRLEGIVAMDAAALAADAGRFRATYGRVGVLPPDQYLALVLQATQGCSWNACTFCDLYRGIPFHARTVAEFAEHLVAVGTFFGDSLALRRSVFIGDANALCLPHDQLAPLLALAGRLRSAAGGLFAFVDMWTGTRTSVEEYRDYARLGLRRVYVGLETGDPGLLEWLRKPGSPGQAVDLVATLHAAEIGVGVIVLLGAGGERFREAHALRTAGILSRMQLRDDDIVYFSELVEPEGAGYADRAAADGVQPLDPAALREQRAAIASGFRPADPRRPPRRATYDLREFIY